jgi:hypothetical protein
LQAQIQKKTMRLGQLSRKLSVSIDELVQFLAAQGVPIENHSNTRLEHYHEEALRKRYPLDATPGADSVEPPGTPPAEIAVAPDVEEEKAPPAEMPELIKAPKVELSGLKVLGKIELPESKKKEPKADDMRRNDQRLQSAPQRQRPRTNPIAKQRELAAREEQKQREERLRLEKERKTQFYLKRLKAQAPPKPVRMYEETTEMSAAENEPAPSSLWGKFMRWLNS